MSDLRCRCGQGLPVWVIEVDMFQFCIFLRVFYVFGTHVEQHTCECLENVNACRHVMFGQSRTNMGNFLATLNASKLTDSPADSHGNLKIRDATLWTIWYDVMWWHIMTSCLLDLPFFLWSGNSAGSVCLFLWCLLMTQTFLSCCG